jgi:tetratricopeptide (TPR) repeat protein
MLRAQKKLSKRELKEDPLITTYAKTVAFYEKHKKHISTSLLVIGLLALAVVFYTNNRKQNNERASLQLAQVYQLFDNGQYEAAINGVPERNIVGLKDIVANYGSADAGEMATFYLADAYARTGKYELALEKFDDFSPAHTLLAVARLAGIAGAYEGLGKYDQAAENFQKAANKNPDDVHVAEYLSNAARNYGLAGSRDQAINLYKKLKKDHATTTFGREADRHIARLTAS